MNIENMNIGEYDVNELRVVLKVLQHADWTCQLALKKKVLDHKTCKLLVTERDVILTMLQELRDSWSNLEGYYRPCKEGTLRRLEDFCILKDFNLTSEQTNLFELSEFFGIAIPHVDLYRREVLA